MRQVETSTPRTAPRCSSFRFPPLAKLCTSSVAVFQNHTLKVTGSRNRSQTSSLHSGTGHVGSKYPLWLSVTSPCFHLQFLQHLGFCIEFMHSIFHSVFKESEIYKNLWEVMEMFHREAGLHKLPPLEVRLSLLWMRTSVAFVSFCHCLVQLFLSQNPRTICNSCIPVFLLVVVSTHCSYLDTQHFWRRRSSLLKQCQSNEWRGVIPKVWSFHLISISFGCPFGVDASPCFSGSHVRTIATNQFHQCPSWIAFPCEAPNPNTAVTAEIPPHPGLHICSRLPQNKWQLDG